MNEFDQFVKHELKVKNYIRYTDDFLIVSENEEYLKSLIPKLQSFLLEKLILELHPRKVAIRKYHQGIDFLGYVIFPHHCLLRARTRKRIFKNLKYKINNYKSGIITRETLDQSIQSYLAVLSHANAYKLGESLKNQIWFWLNE